MAPVSSVLLVYCSAPRIVVFIKTYSRDLNRLTSGLATQEPRCPASILAPLRLSSATGEAEMAAAGTMTAGSLARVNEGQRGRCNRSTRGPNMPS